MEQNKNKKEYKKPVIETDDIIERVALACGKAAPTNRNGTCNGGPINS
ncbi:hypothetical protein JXR93_11245 [bacterium]|nr:hypothetical protein [bacterium]